MVKYLLLELDSKETLIDIMQVLQNTLGAGNLFYYPETKRYSIERAAEDWDNVTVLSNLEEESDNDSD